MTQDAHDGRARPWPKLRSEPAPPMVLFRPRFDFLKNPRTDEVFKRLVLETADWVNVVALTKERRLIVVRQYRFGSESITTEIPGGVIDPGEDSGDAARRELREETGHTAGRWTYLGCVEPNPAFHDNLCHHWLAEEAEQTHPLDLDSGEDIEVDSLTLEEAVARIKSGEIRHGLVLNALCRVLDLSSNGI